ncbi:MAG: phospho-N-acetylmuramoyl-pentapeptide-transferase [Oscillospiraceae bacterium]|nr:phospho-N-acetylmuramoyl-pentapeptide-transferase [Oscillospiraceae bacterium]
MIRAWLITAAIMSFLITWLPGSLIIKFLRKLKYSQTILDIGPAWHKEKQGTPTMGGIIFVISITISALICVLSCYFYFEDSILIKDQKNIMLIRVGLGLFMALSYSLIGFIDDHIKVVKKRNLGLTSIQKLLLQFFVAGLYLFFLHIFKKIFFKESSTIFNIPFLGSYDFGFFYWTISSIMIVGMVNAVNLTDGIDGLNASVTFFTGIFLMIIANVSGAVGLDILSACLVGGCFGFLIYNFYPAKVFMGDTGSLFLGGLICAIIFGVDKPLLLVTSGLVYLVEMFSVMLQVMYFKSTKGKRFFKMSPIHHHFEMSGWHENKICLIFSLAAIVSGLISLLVATCAM